MTPAQEQAFKQIEEILREHFEASVIVVQADDDKKSDVRSSWHGGYATSIGLLELGKLHVWNKQEDDATP